jgi:monoamine oxidase
MRRIALSLVLSLSCLSLQAGEPEWDVVVIGSGMSGLAAAHALHKADLKVLVLEARDRTGGRIWSKKLSNGQVVDLGAAWIHDSEVNPLYKVAKKLGLETEATDYENLVTYNEDGTPWSDKTAKQAKILFRKFQEYLRAQREELDKDKSMAALFNSFVEEGELSPSEASQLRFLLTVSIESDYAIDIDKISVFNWDRDEGIEGTDLLLPKGYVQLIEYFAKGPTIKLNHRVERIQRSQDGIRVETDQGVFAAKYALCTLPLGVLKADSVTFVPPLSDEKRKAMERMGMGVLDKTALLFDVPFWDQKAEVIGYFTPQASPWAFTINLYPAFKQPILLGFNAGSIATQLELQTDQQIKESFIKVLKVIYGDKVTDPKEVVTTRWKLDPFALGSYSHLMVGGKLEDYDTLAQAEGGRLFFAGEATYRQQPATVHGAYASGIRAAEELLKAFK